MRIGVVGAGIAGLVAARELAARGADLTLFDKGRGVGGRTSWRRADPYRFDHGAQYFTARTPDFRGAVEGWLRDGVVARWPARLVAIDADGTRPAGGSDERFVGVPGMNAMARALADGLDVRTGTRVHAVERAGDTWVLADDSGERVGAFDALLMTAPPEQGAELLGPETAWGQRLAGYRLRPCWAVLLGAPEPIDLPFDGAFCDDPVLAWIARDSSKPGRGPGECWVLHANPEWSEARIGADRGRVIEELSAAWERLVGRPASRFEHADAHFWRYAVPAEERLDGCLSDPERRLVVAGDSFRGGRVEGAYRSGLEAASALLDLAGTGASD